MGKRLAIVAVAVAVVVSLMVGIALASAGRGAADPSGQVIHVVIVEGKSQFFDFNHDGLGFGDRLSGASAILDESQTTRLGTSYLDCSIVSRVLEGGTYDCTYVLKFKDGDITTQGIDPKGPSDVLFSVTGGTGIYRGASGEAEYIDTDVTDVIVSLD